MLPFLAKFSFPFGKGNFLGAENTRDVRTWQLAAGRRRLCKKLQKAAAQKAHESLGPSGQKLAREPPEAPSSLLLEPAQ